MRGYAAKLVLDKLGRTPNADTARAQPRLRLEGIAETGMNVGNPSGIRTPMLL